MNLHQSYLDEGVIVNDKSNNVSIEIISDLDENVFGDYEVEYVVKDESGNETILKRKITVESGTDEFIGDFSRDWSETSLEFITSREPDLTDRGYYKMVYIEANPERGFNFPYVIELPNSDFMIDNLDFRKFPLFSVANLQRFDGGYNGSWETYLQDQLLAQIPGSRAYGMKLAEELYVPEITVLVPQPCWGEKGKEDTPWGGLMWFRNLNEHAVALKEVHLEGELLINANGCTTPLGSEVFTPEDLYDIDGQIYNIMLDAQTRLRNAGWNIEEQFFLYGFSNTGEFVQNYTIIYPEMVKAYYSGGSFENLIPVSIDNNVEIQYPYGLSDFEELFNKEFDLEAWNNVAKYNDIGGMDLEGGSASEDSFGVYEYLLEILYEGDSEDKLTMVKNLFHKTVEFGGKSMTIINLQKEHTITNNDQKMILDFFKMNRDGVTPQYFESSIDKEYITLSPDMATTEQFASFWEEVIHYVENEFVPKSSDVAFIYGGVGESDHLKDVYGFNSVINSNSLSKEDYLSVGYVYIILDSNTKYFQNDAIPEVNEVEMNQVWSFVNSDDKRIVIINPESDDVIVDIINNAPEDLLEQDYNYIYND